MLVPFTMIWSVTPWMQGVPKMNIPLVLFYASIFCRFFLNLTQFWTKLRVLMLCFPDFTENSNLKLLFQKLNSKSQKILKNSIYPKTPHSRGRTFIWSLKPKWMIVMQASREVFFVSYLNVASNSSLHFIFFHY
jgi:hypothetical protein